LDFTQIKFRENFEGKRIESEVARGNVEGMELESLKMLKQKRLMMVIWRKYHS